MIKLQSSMSKHIPVSETLSFCGCHFVSAVIPSGFVVNQYVIGTNRPSRFFGKNHGLVVATTRNHKCRVSLKHETE